MSGFSAEEFMNDEVEGMLDTTKIPCPVGSYPAVISKVATATWESKDGSRSGLKAQIMWEIEDEGVREICLRDKVLCRQDVMLDLTDAGKLDMSKGKNLGLGRLRTAVGQNGASRWSWRMLEGARAMVEVGNRVSDKDPDIIYDEVTKCFPIQ